MLIVISCVFLAIVLLLILTFVSWLISEYSVVQSREELSSYECGFEHHCLSRLPLSLRYFILTLVFLIFDIEVMLLSYFPIISVNSPSGLVSLFVFVFFCVILVLGLFYEWIDGSLDWVI